MYIVNVLVDNVIVDVRCIKSYYSLTVVTFISLSLRFGLRLCNIYYVRLRVLSLNVSIFIQIASLKF